jgi:hypothetical protein
VEEIFRRAAHAQFSPRKSEWDEEDKLAEKSPTCPNHSCDECDSLGAASSRGATVDLIDED